MARLDSRSTDYGNDSFNELLMITTKTSTLNIFVIPEVFYRVSRIYWQDWIPAQLTTGMTALINYELQITNDNY